LDKIRRNFFLRFILSILSGIAIFFAFPPFRTGFLAFLGFIPLLAASSENSKSNFFLGTAAGFLFYSLSFFWLYNLAGFFYMLLALYLSLFWGLFLYLVFALPSRGRVFTGAFTWFLLEIIVSCLFTGFPWLLLGLSQWQNFRILKIAGIFGIYGISFLVILANLALFHFFKKKHFTSLFLSLLIFGAVFVFPFERLQKTEAAGEMSVMVVQPGIISSEQKDPGKIFAALKELTWENINGGRPDIVIWPEGSLPDDIDRYPGLKKEVKKLAEKNASAVLLGTFSKAEGELLYNSAFLFGTDAVQVYNKNRLAPFGEFIPGGRWRVIRSVFQDTAGYIPMVKHGESKTLFILGDKRIAPLICFENVFPSMVAEFNMKGAEVFLVVTNDSWYGRFLGPYQHFAHNSMRAAESGKYFVQSSLSGISGVVSPGGHVLETVRKEGEQLFVAGVLFYKVPLIRGETIYSRLGDLPLFLISILFTGVVLCGMRKN